MIHSVLHCTKLISIFLLHLSSFPLKLGIVLSFSSSFCIIFPFLWILFFICFLTLFTTPFFFAEKSYELATHDCTEQFFLCRSRRIFLLSSARPFQMLCIFVGMLFDNAIRCNISQIVIFYLFLNVSVTVLVNLPFFMYLETNTCMGKRSQRCTEARAPWLYRQTYIDKHDQ